MRQPTPTEVVDFYAAMLAQFGAEVRDKSDSGRMRAAGWFLDTMGIMDKETFLRDFTTTIHTTIYVNFRVGDPGDDLWAQMRLLTHECEHVRQARDEGFLHYAGDYLLNSTSRAHYEAEALRCELELEFWHTGQLPDIAAMAEVLRGYALGDEHVAYARDYLLASADTITAGGVISEVGRYAIGLLEREAPGLGYASP